MMAALHSSGVQKGWAMGNYHEFWFCIFVFVAVLKCYTFKVPMMLELDIAVCSIFIESSL